ncbi:hypothetical protein DM01DRAFT_1038671 [Hesseltinella vesiculosa]|uniref:Uncharacterized protein n=1 Tax=Hesseltinella vesiculosa TaxID=101127 RepID=A0A1X2GIQ7_9FUNG|nr:hypothetical protein DM01DRAFT_1038671 [Hesseltinella vesiculosa]
MNTASPSLSNPIPNRTMPTLPTSISATLIPTSSTPSPNIDPIFGSPPSPTTTNLTPSCLKTMSQFFPPPPLSLHLDVKPAPHPLSPEAGSTTRMCTNSLPTIVICSSPARMVYAAFTEKPSTSGVTPTFEGKTKPLSSTTHLSNCRSLKVMADPQWCTTYSTILGLEEDDPSICICNDDMDDPDHVLYPWAANHNIPLTLGDNKIYYNSINAISSQDWRSEMNQRVQGEIPPADIVILGVGNDDVASSRLKPNQFAQSFTSLLSYLIDHVYPTQTIIVRTPQFFGSGEHYWTAWNAGRSRAFTNVIRTTIQDWQHPRIRLWDTHQFGLEYNTCRYQGTLYTKRNAIDVENSLLYSLICSP